MTKTALRPLALILSCITALALVSLTGCTCDQKHSSAESSSMTMSSDSKDMNPHSSNNSH